MCHPMPHPLMHEYQSHRPRRCEATNKRVVYGKAADFADSPQLPMNKRRATTWCEALRKVGESKFDRQIRVSRRLQSAGIREQFGNGPRPERKFDKSIGDE